MDTMIKWRLGIGLKVAVLAGSLSAVSLIVLGITAIWSSSSSLSNEGMKQLNLLTDNVYNICQIHHEQMVKRLQAGLDQLADMHAVKDGKIQEHVLRDVTSNTGFWTAVLRIDQDRLITVAQQTPKQWQAKVNESYDYGINGLPELTDADGAGVKQVINGGTFVGRMNVKAAVGDRDYYQWLMAMKTIGDNRVLAIGIPFVQFTELRKSIKNIKIAKTGYVYTMSINGTPRIHPTSEGKNQAQLDAIRHILETRNGVMEYPWEGRLKVVDYRYYEPYDWIVASGSYLDEFNAPATTLMWKLTGMIVLFLLAIVVGSGLLGMMIARGVNVVVNAAKDIAEGEGDLTKRLSVKARDETGDLANWFNRFIIQVHEIIRDVEQSAMDVSAASTEVAASAEEMSTGISKQRDQTTQVSAAVEQMASTISEVAHQASEASDTAGSAGQHACEGGQIVRCAIDDIRRAAETVHDSAKLINALGQRSEQIGQIIDVINDIADQTNLLALNAAIEAARAGEHGRGFAVVADEVRQLAGRTTQATKEVAESISAIQQETAKAVQQMNQSTIQVEQGVKAAEQAGQSLQTIVSQTEQVASMIQSIAAATQQQSTAANEISRSIELIESISRESAVGANQSAQTSTQLSHQAEHLRSMVRRFKI